MSADRETCLKIIDAQNLLSDVKHLTEAAFMAAGSIGDMHQTNAIQSVLNIVQQRLEEAETILCDVRKPAE